MKKCLKIQFHSTELEKFFKKTQKTQKLHSIELEERLKKKPKKLQSTELEEKLHTSVDLRLGLPASVTFPQ